MERSVETAMEARDRRLPDWFARIRTGQILLPVFQRFEAWGAPEVVSLLEAVLGGLPAGATLVLQIGADEPFESRPIMGAPEPTARAVEYLLDGQQRLTALWRSFHDGYDDRAYFARIDGLGENEAGPVESVGRWVRKGRRYPLWVDDPKDVLRRGLVPLALLRPGDLGGELPTWCKAAVGGDANKALDLLGRVQVFRDRVAAFNIPFLFLPASTPKGVALDVFIKMNTSSVQLGPYDIVVAQVEAKTGKHLHELVASLATEVLDLPAYSDPSEIALSVAALRQDKPPTKTSFLALDLDRFVREWPDLIAGIAFAVEFLEDEAVFDAERLPTGAVLPVLAALHAAVPQKLDEKGNARSLLRRYVWRSFFTDRYVSAAATRAYADCQGLKDVLRSEQTAAAVPVFDDERYPLPTVERLKRARWPKTKDILARAILGVSLRGGALDIADAKKATRKDLRQREYHHLFPDHLLTGSNDGGLSQTESYRALNCALITHHTNRAISAKEPLEYLRERIDRAEMGEAEIRARLATHAIPFGELAVGGYSVIVDPAVRKERIAADYERFLDARAALISERMEALCAGQPWA